MKKQFVVVLFLILVAAFSGASTVFAQFGTAQSDLSEDELALVEFVAAAFDNMRELESMATEGNQTIEQTIGVQGQTVNQTIEQIITGKIIFNEDGNSFEMSVEQFIGTEIESQNIDLDIEMTMNMIAIDDSIFIRVSDASPEIASQFPRNWVDIVTDPNAIPGMEGINLDQYSQMINSSLQYPITKDTISAISEVEGDEIEESAMRVFEITMDSEGFMESDEFDAISAMFNPGGLGNVDVDNMMSQMFQGENIEMKVWIGEEDELVHRIEVIININAEIEDMIPGAGTVDLIQDLNGTYDYFDFNEPFEIEAPPSDA